MSRLEDSFRSGRWDFIDLVASHLNDKSVE